MFLTAIKNRDMLNNLFNRYAYKFVKCIIMFWKILFQWMTYDQVLLRAQNFGSGRTSYN